MSRKPTRKHKTARRKRRTQSDIMIQVLKCTPTSKPASINSIAKRCNTTWRTANKNIDTLTRAGVVKRVKKRGQSRAKYVRA